MIGGTELLTYNKAYYNYNGWSQVEGSSQTGSEVGSIIGLMGVGGLM